MPVIFISYRREDSEHSTDRIYEALRDRFGEREVFKDVDSIPLGPDFRQVLGKAISESDVLLAVIGDRWLEITDSDGRPRLEDPNDFVRIEIESAIARGVHVIPLLVGRAPMPKPEALVPSLQPLAYRNGMPIRAGRDFRHDIEHLIRDLEQIHRSTEPAPSPPEQSEADLIAVWVGKRRLIDQTQAEVQELVSGAQDYARAVALLETIPAQFRDENLYQSVRAKRDRVDELDREIRQAVESMELDGLRPRIEELRALKPQRPDLSRLLDVLAKHDQARHHAEDEHDYARAVSLLEELPVELRDTKLYRSLLSKHEAIVKLENERAKYVRTKQREQLRETVDALLKLCPNRVDLCSLRDMLMNHAIAEALFRSSHDSNEVLELLDRVSPDLRDPDLYGEALRRRRLVGPLEQEIRKSLKARKALGLRSHVEQLQSLAPEKAEYRQLLDAILVQERAARLLADDAVLEAAALLDGLPAEVHDGELFAKVMPLRDKVLHGGKLLCRNIRELRFEQIGIICNKLCVMIPKSRDCRLLRALGERAKALAGTNPAVSESERIAVIVELFGKVPAAIRDPVQYKAFVTFAHECAAQLVNADRDYDAGIAILEGLPEDVRDPNLFQELADRRSRAYRRIARNGRLAKVFYLLILTIACLFFYGLPISLAIHGIRPYVLVLFYGSLLSALCIVTYFTIDGLVH